MSRLRLSMAGRHAAVAVMVLAFLAVGSGDPGRRPATGAVETPTPALVTAAVTGLGELLVPTRASVTVAGLVDAGSGRTRPLLQPALTTAAAGLLVLVVAGLARRRPGPPWHVRRRHSAVLRAPPLLLHP